MQLGADLRRRQAARPVGGLVRRFGQLRVAGRDEAGQMAGLSDWKGWQTSVLDLTDVVWHLATVINLPLTVEPSAGFSRPMCETASE